MTWQDAIDVVATHAGVSATLAGRFRVLCAEDNPDVVQRDEYRGEMIRRALGLPKPVAEPPPESAPDPRRTQPHGFAAPVPLDRSLGLLRRMKQCPHRSPTTGCGCGGMARCALGKGVAGLVSHLDCFACLGQTPAP